MDAPDTSSPVDETLGSLTVALAMACPHCASPTPVNGPLQSVRCDACLKDLPVRGLAEQLEASAEGYQWMNSPFLASGQQVFEASDVQCETCEALIPIEPHLGLVGQTTTIACPGCATPCPTHPAPDWLVERLPGAVQVFGGERPASADAGVAVETSEASAEAVLMSCPGCGGGLRITADLERTMTCQYCSSSVFIPDPIWKRLHPVRLLRRWTLLFRGEVLETREKMEERAEEAKAEATRSAREEASRQRAAAREAKTAKSSTKLRPDLLATFATLTIGGLCLNILGAPLAAPLSWWPSIGLIVLGAALVGVGVHRMPPARVRAKKGQVPPGRFLMIGGAAVAMGGAFLAELLQRLTV